MIRATEPTERPGRRRPAYRPKLADAFLERVAARFLALADPTRLKVLQRICAGEAPVQVVAGDCGLTPSNTSRHLGVLLAQGFVVRRRAGVQAIYAVADETAEQLCGVICAHLAAVDDRFSRRVPAGRR